VRNQDRDFTLRCITVAVMASGVSARQAPDLARCQGSLALTVLHVSPSPFCECGPVSVCLTLCLVQGSRPEARLCSASGDASAAT
jgi:hypothetical protein